MIIFCKMRPIPVRQCIFSICSAVASQHISPPGLQQHHHHRRIDADPRRCHRLLSSACSSLKASSCKHSCKHYSLLCIGVIVFPAIVAPKAWFHTRENVLSSRSTSKLTKPQNPPPQHSEIVVFLILKIKLWFPELTRDLAQYM